ncbi:MAG: DUF3575 domain-containing protein [Bacteroidaceae bacterium]|nr:DUF3575 domain-containing protein [Bacteroidaceae bacterium]
MIKKIFIIGLLLLSVSYVKAQMVAIKSDIVKDVAMIPSLGTDIVVGEKHTIGLNLYGCTKPWGKDLTIMAISPEFRYWFSGRPFTRHFIGFSAQMANYDIHWNKKIYEGNSVAMGVAMGYTLNLSKRLNLELLTGLNVLGFKQKEYYEGDRYDYYGSRTNSDGIMLVPRIEASISYIIR